MTDKPETVADVLADGRRIEAEARRLYGESEGDMLGNVLDRIERAMAASAVQDDAKDAARFRWLRDHAINTEGAKGSPWCVYGLDLGDCTPAFGAELVAMVDDAMANGIVCSPVPVESLGRDAPDPVPLNAVRAALEAVDTGRTQIARDNLRILEIHLRAQSAPPPASVPDGFYLASFKHATRNGAVVWWQPDNAGYTPDLEQAGIYTEITPGYHDSEHTVPVPVRFLAGCRIRRTIDPGDLKNRAFWSAADLRAAIDTTPEESP